MIKTTIKESKPEPEIQFPCIMTVDGNKRLVLFLEPGKGVELYDGGCPSGRYSDKWFMPDFQPFHGEVTISNTP